MGSFSNHPKSSQIKKRHSSSVSFCSSFLGPAFELLRDLECFKDCRALAKKNCLVDSCAFWLCPRRKPNHCSIGNSVIRPKPSIQGQKLAGLVWHIKAVTSATLWMFWHVCGAMKHEPRGCFISEHFPAAIKAKTSTATKPDNAISHRSFKERALVQCRSIAKCTNYIVYQSSLQRPWNPKICQLSILVHFFLFKRAIPFKQIL